MWAFWIHGLELQEKKKGGDSSATTSPLQVKKPIPLVLNIKQES